MALSKTITLQNNFLEDSVFPNAYIKVIDISGSKNQIDATVAWRKEKDGLDLQLKTYTFTPDLNGNNFISQAYNHLKTLPEFEGATDC